MSVLEGIVRQTRAPSLHDWQKDHVERISFSLKKFDVALDASDMGTGKTVMSFFAARECGLIPVIVCPKAVIPIWEEWYGEFFPNRAPIVFNYEKAVRGNKFVERQGKRFGWKLKHDKVLLIFDEVHKCKGSKSLNSGLVAAAKRDGVKMLMLSATPFHTPVEMRSIGYALGLHGYRDWWHWCLRNGCRRGWFGGLVFGGSRSHLLKINDLIFGSGLKGSRIRISDLPKGSFPEGMVEANAYEVDNPSKIDSIYANLRDDLYALEERRSLDVDSENPLTVQLRARQEVELLKVPIFCELCLEALEAGRSVVIFVNFISTLGALLRHAGSGYQDPNGLPATTVTIDGVQTDAERAESIKGFQSGQDRICIAMIQAGGVGLSLHDETGDHPRVALISPTFSAVDLKQALGRIRRSGGKSFSHQKIVFAAGTVEEDVCLSVRSKLSNMDLLTDADLTDPIL
tara:strand:- start:13083 stop:14456 length:1374 start_codon:yes stop_codon:yes gene_type:complete